MEKTILGQHIERSSVCCSLALFESVYIDASWSFLSSVDCMQHHATWINNSLKQLKTFCEGDVITIHCDSTKSFYAEQVREMRFCDDHR